MEHDGNDPDYVLEDETEIQMKAAEFLFGVKEKHEMSQVFMILEQ